MEVLNIALPALIVFFTAYLLFSKMLNNEERRRIYELRKTNMAALTPIRLRAYERLTLFVERTTPNSLVVNNMDSKMNCFEFHTKLLDTIRQEYAHNISQQIYVSETVWLSINAAKESIVRLINTCAAQCNANQPAAVLAEKIIQVYGSTEQTPSEVALKNIKQEVSQYF